MEPFDIKAQKLWFSQDKESLVVFMTQTKIPQELCSLHMHAISFALDKQQHGPSSSLSKFSM